MIPHLYQSELAMATMTTNILEMFGASEGFGQPPASAYRRRMCTLRVLLHSPRPSGPSSPATHMRQTQDSVSVIPDPASEKPRRRPVDRSSQPSSQQRCPLQFPASSWFEGMTHTCNCDILYPTGWPALWHLCDQAAQLQQPATGRGPRSLGLCPPSKKIARG